MILRENMRNKMDNRHFVSMSALMYGQIKEKYDKDRDRSNGGGTDKDQRQIRHGQA